MPTHVSGGMATLVGSASCSCSGASRGGLAMSLLVFCQPSGQGHQTWVHGGGDYVKREYIDVVKVEYGVACGTHMVSSI